MLLEDVRNFQARSRMQLLQQCLPLSRKNVGQPAQGEAPAATTSFRAAAGVSALSESDPRRATRCVARRVRPSGPTNAAEILAASTNDDLQQTHSLVAATQLRMERLPAAPSPQLISLDARVSGERPVSTSIFVRVVKVPILRCISFYLL